MQVFYTGFFFHAENIYIFFFSAHESLFHSVSFDLPAVLQPHPISSNENRECSHLVFIQIIFLFIFFNECKASFGQG